MTRKILVVALVIIASGLFHAPALALTASPVRLELESEPGKTIQETFKLYNDQRNTQTFYLFFRNFESQGESGEPFFTDKDTGLASWAKTDASITLGALERKEIPITISVPQNTEPGGYTAAVFGSTIPPEVIGEGEVGVQGDVGTLVLLRVNGSFTEGADILEFKTVKDKTFSSLPVDFFYRFQNSGNSWVKPIGDITIKNIFSSTSKVVPANATGSNVLSRSIRRFEASWLTSGGTEVQEVGAQRPPEPPNGFWDKVKHEWKHFALGRYTANLSLTYNNDTSTTTHAKTSFWVMPWHLLGVVLGGLVILIGLITIVVVFVVMTIMRRKKGK